jgi:hypothetical protein
MGVLAHLDENHGQAAVLAQGDSFLSGQSRIFQETPEYFPADRRRLPFHSALERGGHVLAQFIRSFQEKILYRSDDVTGFYFSHRASTS